ncbi:coproporphyrinogen-III oxidase family protein [Ideonella sp. A 288]|uniref:coproporphyrinogen-III oxidase family protein n=1 Tax=Ideonella sp. A 288 TaxID=1962181 RepID=UPI00130388EA|nr:radical SAM protein [Ideonella sp. A 288]
MGALRSLAARADEPVALSVSVPFCSVRCLCCDRDLSTAPPREVLDRYVDGLIDESRNLVDRLGSGRDVQQLHLGGGSANELGEAHWIRLFDALGRGWRLPADAEMSVECDPRRASAAQIRLLRDLGCGLISFGVFDLDPLVQQAIGRRHSPALIDDVCETARRSGIEIVTLELMIGLPQQTPARWRATLDRLVRLAPDRVTLVRYRHRPGQAPDPCALDASSLPGEDGCRALLALAAEVLCGAGYHWIGTGHFVIDTDAWVAAAEQGQLRRGLISCTPAPPPATLGLGAGALGEIDGHLFRNEASIPAWHHAVNSGRLAVAEARLGSAQEARRRQAIDRLMFGLELPAEMVADGLEHAYQRLARHAGSGLVQVLDDRIVVTAEGRLALEALCGELDASAWPGDEAQRSGPA